MKKIALSEWKKIVNAVAKAKRKKAEKKLQAIPLKTSIYDQIDEIAKAEEITTFDDFFNKINKSKTKSARDKK